MMLQKSRKRHHRLDMNVVGGWFQGRKRNTKIILTNQALTSCKSNVYMTLLTLWWFLLGSIQFKPTIGLLCLFEGNNTILTQGIKTMEASAITSNLH
jgi:hypothetical protein